MSAAGWCNIRRGITHMLNIGHFCALGLIIMICEHGLSTTHPPIMQSNHQSDSSVKREVTPQRAAMIRKIRQKNLRGMERKLVLLNIDLQWDRLIYAAPEAVVSLAQLVILAAKDDFPLYFVEPPSTEDLRHSQFQASLIQLVNKARRVFKEASDEMKQIKTNLEKIPGSVKRMVGVLATGDEDGLRADLPGAANIITDTTKKCSHQAIEIENRVISLIDLVGEIDQRLTETAAHLSSTLKYQATNHGHKFQLKKNLIIVKETILVIYRLKRLLQSVLKMFHLVSFVLDPILQRLVGSLINICSHLNTPEIVKEILRDDPMFAVSDAVVTDSSRIVKASEFLKTVVEVYISAFDQYILDPLKNFPKLQTATKTQMKQILLRLARQISVARSAITDIAKAKRKTFKQYVKKSHSELRAMLIPIESSSE